MEFDRETNRLHVGVRELCRIACSAGDIDVRRSSEELRSDNHKILESRAGENAETERPLSIVVPFANFAVCLRGRADIIHKASDDGIHSLPPEVEEIKTVPPQMLGSSPSLSHMAQVKLYALMLCREDDLMSVG